MSDFVNGLYDDAIAQRDKTIERLEAELYQMKALRDDFEREYDRLRVLLSMAIHVVNPVSNPDWHKQAREALAGGAEFSGDPQRHPLTPTIESEVVVAKGKSEGRE